MSDWSSFEKDKAITDKWRSFLKEEEAEEKQLKPWQKWLARRVDYLSGATKDPTAVTGRRLPNAAAEEKYGDFTDEPGKFTRWLGNLFNPFFVDRRGFHPGSEDVQGALETTRDALSSSFAADMDDVPEEAIEMVDDYLDDWYDYMNLPRGSLSEQSKSRRPSLRAVRAEMIKVVMADDKLDKKQKEAAVQKINQKLVALQKNLAATAKVAGLAAKKAKENPNKSDKKTSAKDEKQTAKTLSPGQIKAALSQIRNVAGIDAKDFAAQVEDAFKEVAKGNPLGGDVLDKDLPVINLIVGEITKILNGDFSNLVQESNNNLSVHPVTHDFFQMIISEGVE